MDEVRKDVKNIRRDFVFGELDEKDVPNQPILLFKTWLNEAMEEGSVDPNAFVLSTAVGEEVDSRILLLRDVVEEGLIFYTNYNSNKGKQIEENPRVSLNFFWVNMDRQVRIKAVLEKVEAAISDDYFATRPRKSQIGAWASAQSKELNSREDLEKHFEDYNKKFEGKEVPRPPHWGGYLARPYYFEFWQGRPSRLHDRIAYRINEEHKWLTNRLSP